MLSQCSIYEAGQKRTAYICLIDKATDKEEGSSGRVRSEGDLFLNGAQHCLLEGDDDKRISNAEDY